MKLFVRTKESRHSTHSFFGTDHHGGRGNAASFKILRQPSFPNPGKLTPETKHRDRANSEAHSHHFHHIHFDGTIAGRMKLDAEDEREKKAKSKTDASEGKSSPGSASARLAPVAAGIAAATSSCKFSGNARDAEDHGSVSTAQLTQCPSSQLRSKIGREALDRIRSRSPPGEEACRRVCCWTCYIFDFATKLTAIPDSSDLQLATSPLQPDEGSRISLTSVDLENVLENTDATLHLSNHMRANAVQCFEHHQRHMRGTLGLALDIHGSKDGKQGLPAQELRRIIMDLGHFPSEEECEDILRSIEFDHKKGEPWSVEQFLEMVKRVFMKSMTRVGFAVDLY